MAGWFNLGRLVAKAMKKAAGSRTHIPNDGSSMEGISDQVPWNVLTENLE